MTLVSYSVYVKNSEGAYDLVAEPCLCAAYGEKATISIGQTTQQALSRSLRVTLNASKAQ